MAVSYETAVKLFRLGHFAQLVQGSPSAAALISSQQSPEQRLLLAHALVYTGKPQLAREVAETCLSLSPSSHLQAEIVLGLVAKRSFHLIEAQRHLQHAVRLGRDARDRRGHAWALLHLLRLVIHGESPQVLVPMIGEVRQVVAQSGDPHILVFLHDTIAVLEAQTGRLHEAARHLALGRSILERHPNAWLEQTLEVNSICVACLKLDLVEASKHQASARRLGEITGDHTSSSILDLNEAHAQIAVGRLRQAHSKLQRVQQHSTAWARLPALESLTRIYIALNRLDECSEILKAVSDTSGANQTPGFFPIRWTAVSGTKLLLRRELPTEALVYLRRACDMATTLRDLPLLAALAMLEAEALAAQKAFDRAGISLLKASERDVTTNLELQGHYHHTCGRVLEKHGSALAPFFVDRAYRLWRHRGNVCAMIEAQSEGGPPLEIKDYDVKSVMAAMPTRRPVHGLMTDPVVRSAVVVDSIANAFDLASSPELLAGELRQLITALGCESYAHVAETRTGSTTNGGASTEHVVSLGTERNRTLELRYCAADDPLTSILVADIARVVRSAVAVERMRREESERAAVWPVSDESDDDAVYVDDQMVTLIGAAKRVASVNVPVLITGETGTGKEILARAIHAASTRSGAVFMPFNCTACPRDMIDAQLFGHRRGAFTGATEHSPGVIRATIGGTLFLDEIGETPLDVQPKLLRFLESGEIHPIGETHPVKADVRVIAATNVDLDALVSAGRFREDLFYRLNIVRLHVPPLRERRVEIPTLSHHYLRKYAREFEKGDLRLAEDTMEYLWLYRWPGNVRQLANEVRRMAALAERDAVLMPEHLAPEIAASRRTVPPSERPLDVNEVVVRIDQPMAAALEHLERSMVVHALTACGGRIEETAKKLGLSRKGLYLKRQRFGLDAFEPQEKSA